MWDTVVNINSVLFAIACTYTIYAAGASIYFLDARLLAFGIIICIFLFITEIIFSALAS